MLPITKELGKAAQKIHDPNMKNASPGKRTSSAKTKTQSQGRPPRSVIHPIIIYPFQQPSDSLDLGPLYELVARLNARKDVYSRPITVIDRKTHEVNAQKTEYVEFRKKTVSAHPDILDVWCVDTCQMWYSGLGFASERGGPSDVYWLIPGDFNYGSTIGREVLSRLHDLPEICVELEQDLCIGEIPTDHGNSKQLIDTYGTFALLYNWFPEEAREIRQYTERPRSEFFAIRHGFLKEMLLRRWYAHEQTVVILLHAIFSRKNISRFLVGHITDLPEGSDTLASALQQVERTERVLRSVWLERHKNIPDWIGRFRMLEIQSEQAVRTSLNILQNLLP